MFGPPFSSRAPLLGSPSTPPSHSCPVSFGLRGIGDVVLAHVAVKPVGEVEEAVVHRQHEVGDQPRHRERPALELDGRRPRSPARQPTSRSRGGSATSRCESAAPTKPCSASGSCSQRTSSGTRPFSPRSIVCSQRPRLEIPEVDALPVVAGARRRRGRSPSRRRSAHRTRTRRARSCAAGTRSRS